jgi:uncharacterized protein
MALKVDNKIYLSWDDINVLVEDLCKQIIEQKPGILSVTGLKRGGLIPAVMVSHRLGLPWSDRILPHTLLIDDICDTGHTLKDKVAITTAVLHHKPHTSIFTPDLYAQLHTGDEWIIYPWERKDSEQIQDYLANKE